MRIFVDTNELNAGISTVVKALSARSPMPILEGILMTADEYGLRLKCNDLALQIETLVPATVEESGELVVPGKFFADMTKRLPGESVELKTENESIIITSGRARATVQTMKAADFPSMQELKDSKKVEISQRLFKSMIKQTIFAISTDETKPVFSGVLLELEGETIKAAAMDGYRMAIRSEQINGSFEKTSLVVPGKSLNDIANLLSSGEEKCTLIFNKTHLMVDIEHTRIVTRLSDMEFMKFDHILPKTHETRVRVRRTEAMSAIDRASLMARESSNSIIKLSFKDDKAAIVGNSEIGRTYEEFDVEIMGNGIDIAFNPRFLNDVLKNLEDEDVFIDFTLPLSPAVIRPVSGDYFTYLILPMRVF